jgi:hypothetical protein
MKKYDRDCFAPLAMTGEGLVVCHCEERSDEAIPEGAWQRLLRYARNDIANSQ